MCNTIHVSNHRNIYWACSIRFIMSQLYCINYHIKTFEQAIGYELWGIFYRWKKNWDSKRLNNVSEVKLLINDGMDF